MIPIFLRTPLRHLRLAPIALLALIVMLAASSTSVSLAQEGPGGRGDLPRGGALAPPLRGSALVAQAQAHGMMKVIVWLNTPFTPEGTVARSAGQPIASSAAVRSQRAQIATVKATLVGQLSGHDVRVTSNWESLPGLAVTTDARGLQALLSSPLVREVIEDIAYPPALGYSLPLINASTPDGAWAQGVDGTGFAVAVLDTGALRSHEFLAGHTAEELCFSTSGPESTSLCPGSAPFASGMGAADPFAVCVGLAGTINCDHGTHVSGTVAGNYGLYDRPSLVQPILMGGVAKGADLISVQVFSYIFDCDNGLSGNQPCVSAYNSDIISAVNYIYDNLASVGPGAGPYDIASVNMSFAGILHYGSNCDPDEPTFQAAFANLRSVGIAPVVASGNDGDVNAISSPACVSAAVSVSASTGTSGAEDIAFFSNRGPALELLAPGYFIESSILGANASETTQYEQLAGTSMAAPHVAGAWAVLKQQSPVATVERILTTLQATGVTVVDSAAPSAAYPRIDLGAAVTQLGRDWGDAPATYGTLAANDGPRHIRVPEYALGAVVDSEADGTPGVDDGDDGVTFPAMTIGSTVNVDVSAAVAQTVGVAPNTTYLGRLFAWIDFNRDGDFADAGEQVADGILMTGPYPQAIPVSIPASTSPGTTWARFRYSTESGLSYTGQAYNGEVEDYEITLVAPQSKIVINEIDYDQNQRDNDPAEFIELYNADTVPINLSGYNVRLINGSSPYGVYQTYPLDNVTLPPGGYYVICGNAANVPNCNLDVTPNTGMIQNGAPDAVALRNGSVVVDSVSYEGNTIGGYTEGSGVGLVDNGSIQRYGISRYPNGVDTNVNNVDFSGRCITPGAANSSATSSCPAPAPEIEVAAGSTLIADGGSYDLGATTLGTSIGQTITVLNTGLANLTITTNPATVTGDFTAGIFSATTIVPGGSATFTLTCSATALGSPASGTVVFGNNDNDESPFDFTVTCTVEPAPAPGYDSVPAPGATVALSTTPGTPANDTVVISETGNADLVISGYGLTGDAEIIVSGPAAPFTIADGGPSETLTLTCTSQVVGAFSATLTVSHNVAGSPANYTVTCEVTAAPAPGYDSLPAPGATVALSTTPGTPASDTVVISETGNADLVISGYGLSGDAEITVSGPAAPFTISDGGATETLTLTCTSQVVGSFSATLTVAHNAAGSPANYTVTCEVTAAPAPGYDSAPAPGAAIALNTTSGMPASDMVVISETGNADLVISGYGLSGDAEITVTGPAAPFTIADGGPSETLTLTCTSQVVGAFSATLTVSHNAAGSPANYTVTCEVTAAPAPGYDSAPAPGTTVALSTTPGTPASSAVVISETGDADLVISSYSLTGDPEITVSGPAAPFTISDGGPSETLMLSCSSASVGTFSATLTVSHNAAGSPASYTVTCEVTAAPAPGYDSLPAPGATVALSTTPGTPASSAVVISETGNADLVISGYGLSGDAEINVSGPAAPFTIADGGATETLTLTCTSQTTGSFSATLSVAHNAAGSPANYTVTCEVTAAPAPGYDSLPAPGATVALSTTPGTPASDTVVISETGDADLVIGNYGLSGDAEITVSGPAAPFTIADGSPSETLTLLCTSQSVGFFSATLTVAHNAAGSPANYTVTCEVTAAPAPGYDSLPAPGAAIALNTTSGTPASDMVVISETGNADLVISSYGLTGDAEITVSGPAAPFTIADGGPSETLTLSCTSQVVGNFNATLEVAHNAAGSPATYDVTCEVTAAPAPGYDSVPAPGATVALSTTPGTPASDTLVISETGNADLVIDSYSLTGDAEITVSGPAAPFTIADGGPSETLTLTCTSQSVGPFSATLTVAHNAAGSPATYDVTCEVAEGSDLPPQVISTLPGNGVAGVAVDSTIVIAFNEPVTIAFTGILLECPAGVALAYDSVPALPTGGATSVTLTPLAPLPYDATCRVSVLSSAIGDGTGSPLDGDGDGSGGDDYVFTFSTLPQAAAPESAAGAADIDVFDPAISKIGVLAPGQLGLPGEQLTWTVTLANRGSAAGTNVVVTDTLRPQLHINDVESTAGTFAVSGQTVTLVIPILNPGESVEMQIYTTVIGSPADGVVSNTASVAGQGTGAGTITRSAEAAVSVPALLPSTGYSAQRPAAWIWLVLVAAASVAVILTGWRHLRTMSR